MILLISTRRSSTMRPSVKDSFLVETSVLSIPGAVATGVVDQRVDLVSTGSGSDRVLC